MAKINNPVFYPKEYPFINTDNMTITHNLGYQPMVYLVVNGQMAFCNVTHNSINELVVTFQNAISGIIFLR